MSRATPLPVDERREAILSAALPLFLGCSGDLTTRQIAEAAGVAEGTLFRAFESKTDIIDALVERALDPSAVCASITAIERDLSLEARLTACFELLTDRMRRTTQLFIALMTRQTPNGPHLHNPHADASRSQAIRAAITDVIGADAEQFGVPVEFVAEYVRATAFAVAHPSFAPILAHAEPPIHKVSTNEISANDGPRPHRDAVHCLLHGVLGKEPAC